MKLLHGNKNSHIQASLHISSTIMRVRNLRFPLTAFSGYFGIFQILSQTVLQIGCWRAQGMSFPIYCFDHRKLPWLGHTLGPSRLILLTLTGNIPEQSQSRFFQPYMEKASKIFCMQSRCAIELWLWSPKETHSPLFNFNRNVFA